MGVGAVAGYAALQWLGRSYGSTAAERRRPLPGDDLTRDPLAVTTHAVTIDASPAAGLAVARADGLAPGRVVHRRMGGPVVLPEQRAERGRVSTPSCRTSRSATRSRTVHPRPTASSSWRASNPERHLVLHSDQHLPPVVARPVRCVDRLDVGVRPGRPRQWADSTRAPQPLPHRSVVGRRGVPAGRRPGRLRHGAPDAPRHQGAGRRKRAGPGGAGRVCSCRRVRT